LLEVGSDQVLTTTFSPTDTTDYRAVSQSVTISVSQVTGINDLSENEISIFPVPVADKLMLSGLSAFGNNKKMVMQIISAEGAVVRTIYFENTGNSKSVEISDLPAGLYLMHVFTSNESIMKRFIHD
jgi:hypothetical protein